MRWSAVAISNFSLAGTDLVLAEKDAVGKLATAPAAIFCYVEREILRSFKPKLCAAICNRIATKVQNFALT
jgi:hypothetical protein